MPVSVTYTLNPIGKVRTKFKESSQAPRQGRFSDQVAYLELEQKYVAGLKDIETVSHLIVPDARIGWQETSHEPTN